MARIDAWINISEEHTTAIFYLKTYIVEENHANIAPRIKQVEGRIYNEIAR